MDPTGGRKKQDRILLPFMMTLTLFLSFCHGSNCTALTVTLAWDANQESDLQGYMIYYDHDGSGPPYDGDGASEGSSPIIVPLASLADPMCPQFTLTGLSNILDTYFVVTAFDAADNMSGYSNEVIFTSPAITPTVTTTAASNITARSAISGGNITSDGGAPVTARGVCWNTSVNPTISNSKTVDGTGTGGFTSAITGLSPNSIYHVRAYATNSVGTSYGGDETFATATETTSSTSSTTSSTTTTTTVMTTTTSTDTTTIPPSPCPECSGDPVVLRNTTFPSGTVCECTAATSITIGPNVLIESGATVLFKSRKIEVKAGVDVQPGAVVTMNQE